MPQDDPYAAIAQPIQAPSAQPTSDDPYAAIAQDPAPAAPKPAIAPPAGIPGVPKPQVDMQTAPLIPANPNPPTQYKAMAPAQEAQSRAQDTAAGKKIETALGGLIPENLYLPAGDPMVPLHPTTTIPTTDALYAGQKYLSEPLQKTESAIVETGKEAGRMPAELLSMEDYTQAANKAAFNDPNRKPNTPIPQPPPEYFEQQAKRQHPVVSGLGEGVGEFSASLLTPTNLALMAALPEVKAESLLSKIVASGFAVQMDAGLKDEVQNMAQNWDRMSTQERTATLTQLPPQVLMALLATVHASHEVLPSGHSASKDVPSVQPEQTTEQPVAQPSGAVEKPVEAADNGLTRGPVPERFKPIVPDPYAAIAKETPVSAIPSGQKTGGNPAPTDAIPPTTPQVSAKESGQTPPKKTRLQTAKDIDRVGSGKVAATELAEGYEPKADKRGKTRVSVATLEDGRRIGYNPAKTNEQTIQEHASRGELYKLTGEQPPAETREAVSSDIRSSGAAERSDARNNVPKGSAPSVSGDRAEGLSRNSDVILARHGETKLDQEGAKDTVAGWTAEPLDERGRKSAAGMADELKGQPVSHIVTSDLERARETAGIVGAKLDVPVEEDSRLRPQHTPETEGKQMGEAKPIHDYYVEHPDERPPGGETYNETLKRQRAAIAEAKQGSPEGQKPVVLTHSRNIEAELGKTPEPGGIAENGRKPLHELIGKALGAGDAEDLERRVREQPRKEMPRGERRKTPRTAEETQTQELFGKARKELGEDASSDQIMARVQELKKGYTPERIDSGRDKILESEIKHLKDQTAQVSKEFSLKSGRGYDPHDPLVTKYNDLLKQTRAREDELAKLRGEPTHAEKRDARDKEAAKPFAERSKEPLTYSDAKQSQHWQVLEPDYIEKRFQDKIKTYERAVAESRGEVTGSKEGTKKRADAEMNLKYRKDMLQKFTDRDPRQAQSFKNEYNDLTKKALSQGKPVPEDVIGQKREFEIAKDARERYEKGRHTSFANKSAAINDTMQKEEGFKVKRQDGKPITDAQMKEISSGVDDVVKVLGEPLRHALRGTDLTIAHTSGKHPFLSDAGGLYHPVDRTVTAGIEDFLGRPVKALAHELGHWFDYESGRAIGVKNRIYTKGGKGHETQYLSESDSSRQLYDLARRSMTDTREVSRMLKITKLSDLPENERAEVERVKVVLGTYWRESREVFARMFEQYIADELGKSSTAAEDIAKYHKAPAWWSKEAWDKLKPLMAQEIAKRMDALKERYAPKETIAPAPAAPAPVLQQRPKSELTADELGERFIKELTEGTAPKTKSAPSESGGFSLEPGPEDLGNRAIYDDLMSRAPQRWTVAEKNATILTRLLNLRGMDVKEDYLEHDIAEDVLAKHDNWPDLRKALDDHLGSLEPVSLTDAKKLEQATAILLGKDSWAHKVAERGVEEFSFSGVKTEEDKAKLAAEAKTWSDEDLRRKLDVYQEKFGNFSDETDILNDEMMARGRAKRGAAKPVAETIKPTAPESKPTPQVPDAERAGMEKDLKQVAEKIRDLEHPHKGRILSSKEREQLGVLRQMRERLEKVLGPAKAPEAKPEPAKIPLATSDRMAKKSINVTDDLLVRRAIDKATAANDDYNLTQFKGIDSKKITPAERNNLNVYLFGSTEGGKPEDLLRPQTRIEKAKAVDAEKRGGWKVGDVVTFTKTAPGSYLKPNESYVVEHATPKSVHFRNPRTGGGTSDSVPMLRLAEYTKEAPEAKTKEQPKTEQAKPEWHNLEETIVWRGKTMTRSEAIAKEPNASDDILKARPADSYLPQNKVTPETKAEARSAAEAGNNGVKALQSLRQKGVVSGDDLTVKVLEHSSGSGFGYEVTSRGQRSYDNWPQGKTLDAAQEAAAQKYSDLLRMRAAGKEVSDKFKREDEERRAAKESTETEKPQPRTAKELASKRNELTESIAQQERIAEAEHKIIPQGDKERAARKAADKLKEELQALPFTEEGASIKAQIKDIDKKLKDLPDKRSWGAPAQDNSVVRQREKLEDRKSELESKLRFASSPRIEPEASAEDIRAKAKDRYDFQKKYFVQALEPAIAAWQEKLGQSYEWVSQNKYAGNPSGKPADYPSNMLRIEIPGDGKFLIFNDPKHLEHAVNKIAPKAFAKPVMDNPDAPRKPFRMSAKPAEADKQRWIEHLKDDLKDAENRTGIYATKYGEPVTEKDEEYGGTHTVNKPLPDAEQDYTYSQVEEIKKELRSQLAEMRGQTATEKPKAGTIVEYRGKRYIVADKSHKDWSSRWKDHVRLLPEDSDVGQQITKAWTENSDELKKAIPQQRDWEDQTKRVEFADLKPVGELPNLPTDKAKDTPDIKPEGEPTDDFVKRHNPESGFATPEALSLPITLPINAARYLGDLYDRTIDRLLEKVQMGKPRPEIRQHDESLADSILRMDGGLKYHKAVVANIVKEITAGLSRDQEKGFVFLSDKVSRDWLEKNKPDEFNAYSADPAIQKALTNYKPYEDLLRTAVKELGGKTIDEDYLHRAYDEYTAGVGKKGAPGSPEYERLRKQVQEQGGEVPPAPKKGTFAGGTYDEYITPQSDRMKGRTASAEYYYEHGLHEFGPSFGPRWMAVMSKLDEHRAAVEFYSKATKLSPGDTEPPFTYYNGKQFFSPEMARQIREARPGSKEAQALAAELGITELPKPNKVETYAVTSPFKGVRRENMAAGLARAVLGEQEAKGIAAGLLNSFKVQYAGPKDIVDVFEHAHRDALPTAGARLMTKLAPLTKFVRQQVIGFGLGVPHYLNILRRVANNVEIGRTAANPASWPAMWKVLFDKELKARAISGTDDPTFNMLLRNSGISVEGAEEFKHYVDGNLSDPKTWGNAFKKEGTSGGRVTLGSAAAGPFRMATEVANRYAEVGHRNLFKPGGVDQRARLWLADYLRDHNPELSDAEVSHAINDALGRYNRTSWTGLQRTVGPLMLFPGWDFSSMSYVLRHPIRSALPPAIVVWLANRALHSAGQNSGDDKNDPFYVHVGRWSFMTNLLSEPMAKRVMGFPLRTAAGLLNHKPPGQSAGEAIKHIPSDVSGLSVGQLNPLLSVPADVAYNRVRPGSSTEIIRHGDEKRRGAFLRFRGGKAAEDVGEEGLKRLSPIYDRASEANSGFYPAAAGLSGVTAFKRKRLH